MAIAIKLSANQALALSDAAARLQVRETELAAADTEEWLQQVEALRAELKGGPSGRSDCVAV